MFMHKSNETQKKNTHTRNQRENERKRGKIDRRGFDDIVYYRETRKKEKKRKTQNDTAKFLCQYTFVSISFTIIKSK